MDLDLGVIPEVFYDLIGRIMPGILILFCVSLVVVGPIEVSRFVLWNTLDLNIWMALIGIVISYFIAIVLTNIWDFFYEKIISRKKYNDKKDGDSVDFNIILKQDPGLASRLIKLSAEQNMCKAMIVGLTILSIINLWIWFSGSSIEFDDRFWLIIGFLISILSFLEWLHQLKNRYDYEINNFKPANDKS